ncbi:ABC transporter permease [Streptosporangium saharense]|uniref:ABC transporter permease n=1 Tax=Streptosporangium saharense TaxID=1706840 RepID=UPI003320DC38
MSVPVSLGAMPRRLGSFAWQAVLPVFLVLGYQVAASAARDPFFPALPDIWQAFVTSWTGPGFTRDVAPSLIDLFAGYVLGVAGGLAGGIVLGRAPRVRATLNPLVSFALTLPPVALLPLFLMLLGIGPQMQIGVIAFSVFFTLLINTTEGLRSADPALGDLSAVYRIGGLRRLLVVQLPAAAPYILAAMRTCLSTAVLVMVVSEMVGASQGIGAQTLLAQQSFAYEQMWAGMLLLAVLGCLLNTLFTLAERAVLRRAGLLPATSTGARP